ncbi:M15 family metallopeptidase [Macrococcoides caseolyticum]|uniref:M15 family metallopeptidase n=1 Tax=Macrococcoides caseolyticum TaxID=69966 RepID=UPI001F40AC83|nr:M15 family metallopeptidase [Macrococcus caseolyticus]MCE4956610.1 M15 family metallopeptidase [Macrococcus caseolyticus]
MNTLSKVAISSLLLLTSITPLEQAQAVTQKKSCTITVSHKKISRINGIPIANKQYYMSRHFNPGANKSMIKWFKKMKYAAQKQGIVLDIVGQPGAYGFRSYATQQYLYNQYVYNYGATYANRISARPGTSEHQLGLAMDIRDGSNYGTLTTAFEYTRASKFLQKNAHKYGFIIRYLKGKEHITGFMYEPWHIRYVGRTHATRIKANKVTLEEYFGIQGKKKRLPSGKHKVRGVICKY